MAAVTNLLLGTLIAFFTQSSSFVFTTSIVRPERSHPICSTKTIQTDVYLSQMTVVELKDRLRQLNLPLGGRKDDLVKRLLDYSHKTDNFKPKQDNTASSRVKKDALSFKREERYNDTYYYNLTVPAIKYRLKKLGLSVGGRKVDLIKRLLELNENTQTEDDNGLAEKSSDFDLLHPVLLDKDDNNANNKGESESSTRRARRKKFWKTKEVRELIDANDKNAIAKAEEMISWLERMASEEINEEYLPGPIQYTTLIEAYARSGTADAPQRAEKVINRLLSASSISPTTPMLNASK